MSNEQRFGTIEIWTPKFDHKKYKVVGKREMLQPQPYEATPDDLKRAGAMKEQYGLPMSVASIVQSWRWYSEEYYSAGWVIDTKDAVEQVFGVVLEEVR